MWGGHAVPLEIFAVARDDIAQGVQRLPALCVVLAVVAERIRQTGHFSLEADGAVAVQRGVIAK